MDKVTMANDNNSNNNNNIFRVSFLRYGGYANEIGEAFRYQYPRFVGPSYMIAIAYVLADACYVGCVASRASHVNNISTTSRNSNNISTNLSKIQTQTALVTSESKQQHQGIDTFVPTSILDETTNNAHSMNTTAVQHAVLDALIWQSLASVILPGVTINLIVQSGRFIVNSSNTIVAIRSIQKLSHQNFAFMFQKWFPTILGLGSIPFIVHPIDHCVDWVMDSTFRPQK